MKIIRFLLFPITILYDLITTIRNFFFDKGLLKSTKFNIPVIAVGNLSVGGTGKTPQIEYLIRLLLKDDYKIAVLSRGYKRKTTGFQILHSKHTAIDVGDEPLQFFKKFSNITVAVDADRTNGINQLLKSNTPPDVILLDDAFQHRKVNANLYILLTQYNSLYINDFILPTGNLRESKRGAKRAAIIVVTKCPEYLSTSEQQNIINKLNPNKNQQVFFSTISYDEQLRGIEQKTINEIKDKEIILVTGIANPNPLLDYLSHHKIQYKHLSFPDHHNFTEKDIESIKQAMQFGSSQEKVVLTTEKDAMRLSTHIPNLYALSIKTKFLTNENQLVLTIKNRLIM